jgi:hypothetical protein
MTNINSIQNSEEMDSKDWKKEPIEDPFKLKITCDCGKYHEDDCKKADVVCEHCNGTGVVEIMGGSDADEWGVIDTKPCICSI